MSQFSIEASCEAAALTIACIGELDAAACPVLVDAVTAHDAAGADEAVVIDLERLSFIDSSGIATLIRLQQQLAAREVRLEVRSPSRSVRRAFEMCGVLRQFGLDASRIG